MRVPGIGRVKRWLRRAAVSLRSQVVILMYHRIIDPASDPWGLCVSPKHFAEQMEHVRRSHRVLSLRGLIRTLTDGRLPKRVVVLTFDDGYVDNLWNAKPILEKYELPATVFVTAGYVGSDREFWWDELERLLLHPGALPETLRLSLNGTSHRWELGEAAHYSEDAYRRHRCWNAGTPGDPTPRHRACRDLHRSLRPLGCEEQKTALGALQSQASADGAQARTGYRALTRDEVYQLAAGGIVEIGAHTVSHPVLSALPATAQRAEIQESKARLEEILGRPVTSFAYPYGTRSDYTSETVAVVRETGFACACSTFANVVRRRTDRFQLPRFVVRDWGGEEFAARLREWFREL